MSTQGQAAGEKQYDPLDALRAMRDAYLGAMSKTMTEAVNTEAYAQANGAVLDSYLTVSGPAKEALDKSMLQALEQLSLPSRLDIISLAERFTNIEMRLDDMDRKLDDLVKLSRDAAAALVATHAPQAPVPAKRASVKKSAAKKFSPAKKAAKKRASR